MPSPIFQALDSQRDPASRHTPTILKGLAIALARVVLLAAAPYTGFPQRSLLAPELTDSQWLVAVWLTLPLVIGGARWIRRCRGPTFTSVGVKRTVTPAHAIDNGPGMGRPSHLELSAHPCGLRPLADFAWCVSRRRTTPARGRYVRFLRCAVAYGSHSAFSGASSSSSRRTARRSSRRSSLTVGYCGSISISVFARTAAAQIGRTTCGRPG